MAHDIPAAHPFDCTDDDSFIVSVRGDDAGEITQLRETLGDGRP
ncbi:hypothetical protein [Glycomyces sp. L485]|nr:hypothetical protein [Glycomyces sp. L485]